MLWAVTALVPFVTFDTHVEVICRVIICGYARRFDLWTSRNAAENIAINFKSCIEQLADDDFCLIPQENFRLYRSIITQLAVCRMQIKLIRNWYSRRSTEKKRLACSSFASISNAKQVEQEVTFQISTWIILACKFYLRKSVRASVSLVVRLILNNI